MAFEWKEAIIVNIIDETPTTKRFFFEVKDGSIFDFTPGQFITLDLPIHEKRNKRWRSYSIASYPNGTHQFELVIVLLEGGLGTTYLFNEVKVGDTVSFRGPQGVFILPKTLDKDLYLICTGTGVAPFRSMVHFIHQNKIPHQAIHLIFGCRKFTDCLYEQELKQLEKDDEKQEVIQAVVIYGQGRLQGPALSLVLPLFLRVSGPNPARGGNLPARIAYCRYSVKLRFLWGLRGRLSPKG